MWEGCGKVFLDVSLPLVRATSYAGSNPVGCNDLRRDPQTLSHTLPTSRSLDLAKVLDKWATLPPTVREQVVAMIRGHDGEAREKGTEVVLRAPEAFFGSAARA